MKLLIPLLVLALIAYLVSRRSYLQGAKRLLYSALALAVFGGLLLLMHAGSPSGLANAFREMVPTAYLGLFALSAAIFLGIGSLALFVLSKIKDPR